MKKSLAKASALILILAMLLSFATAGAATVMYASSAVNVRSGPGTNYAVLGYLDKGDAVAATGTVIGKWVQIQYSKYEIGYVSSAYLTRGVTVSTPSQSCPTGSTNLKVCSDCGDIYYATTDLNVRKGPGTKYAIVDALAKGQQCTRIGKSGNWYQLLTADGSVAYASASYLKLYKASAKPEAGKEESSSTNKYYYATTGLNIRKGPGTKYSILGSLEKGEKVMYTGKSGNWYKIRTSDGISGYCYKSYLSASVVKPDSKYSCCKCGIAVANSNNCYINGGICVDGKYYCGDCYDFCWNCPTGTCTNNKAVFTVGKTYKVVRSTLLYSKPGNTATHSLMAGSKVTVISCAAAGSSWVHVKMNECGCYGYVSAACLAK